MTALVEEVNKLVLKGDCCRNQIKRKILRVPSFAGCLGYKQQVAIWKEMLEIKMVHSNQLPKGGEIGL